MALSNQMGWYVDLKRCIGCHTCYVGCKAENGTGDDTHWRRVMTVEGGTYPKPTRWFVSLACNHCADPACLKSCPVSSLANPGSGTTGNPNKNAIVKRGVNGDMNKDDGIVYVDTQHCIGCKRCVWACPFGAMKFDENVKKAEKCLFCKHRIDANLKPACVTTCVGDALRFGKLSDIDTAYPSAVKQVTGFANPTLTNPSTRFKPPY